MEKACAGDVMAGLALRSGLALMCPVASQRSIPVSRTSIGLRPLAASLLMAMATTASASAHPFFHPYAHAPARLSAACDSGITSPPPYKSRC